MDHDTLAHIFEPFFTTKAPGPGHRARPGDGVRHRPAERRPHRGVEHQGRRLDLHDLPAADDRADDAERRPPHRAAAGQGRRDDPAGRGRRRRARAGARRADAARLQGAGRARRQRGLPAVAGLSGPDPHHGHRRDHADHERPAGGRADRHPPAGDQGAVHLGLHRRPAVHAAARRPATGAALQALHDRRARPQGARRARRGGGATTSFSISASTACAVRSGWSGVTET